MSEVLPLIIRPAAVAEANWILSTWKNGAMSSVWAKALRPGQYWRLVNHVIDRLLPRLTVLVAVLEEHPDVTVAWIAARGDYILGSFCKARFASFASQGIDARLRAALPSSAAWLGFDPFTELEFLP